MTTEKHEGDQGSPPGDADAAAAEAERWFNTQRQRTAELVAGGLREGYARGLAGLEARISQWRPVWGDDLVVLIYGDFDEPVASLDFPDLGITIEAGKVTDSPIGRAVCVLKARVKIPEKTVDALVQAAAKIDTLLGVLAALNWGRSAIGWWSPVTHGGSVSVCSPWESDHAKNVVESLKKLQPAVVRKVGSALYWIREPRRGALEFHRSDVLQVYAGYWNAFECLVEAVCLLHPQTKQGRAEKQAGIDEFVAGRNGKWDAAAISECYRTFVDPGFVAKASHALRQCFPDRADRYIAECFRMKPEQDRLYNIRNAINHGDVDAGNPSELLRVEDRHVRLWMIVFGMIEYIIPVPRPLDSELV